MTRNRLDSCRQGRSLRQGRPTLNHNMTCVVTANHFSSSEILAQIRFRGSNDEGQGSVEPDPTSDAMVSRVERFKLAKAKRSKVYRPTDGSRLRCSSETVSETGQMTGMPPTGWRYVVISPSGQGEISRRRFQKQPSF
ncbi:hypothetical protein M408DRAFT_280396 [Serendipita vermifera MAFF 305830]|uniref:Uncharacterized protein n=1 Tax=Serendipita vermifera MAFF 305830 TaxID=933852 RepID=A0A0C2WZJ6_SERVB|nr:hypothetical protein M408DRAFT_280396 [Serendipita vermifera MAFF 305830]